MWLYKLHADEPCLAFWGSARDAGSHAALCKAAAVALRSAHMMPGLCRPVSPTCQAGSHVTTKSLSSVVLETRSHMTGGQCIPAAAPLLEALELDLNEVTPDGASALGGALVGKQHLQRLSLRENELEDAGARHIARSLALCNALVSLDLCANQVCVCSCDASAWGHAPGCAGCLQLPWLFLLACTEAVVYATVWSRAAVWTAAG